MPRCQPKVEVGTKLHEYAQSYPRIFLDTVCKNSYVRSPKVGLGGRMAVLSMQARQAANLWRARDFTRLAQERRGSGIGTGFAELDAAFFDGGWPRSGLAELLCDTPGIGELRLLVPALAALASSEERWIAWVAPPFVPFAPALAAAGIDLAKLLLVRTDSSSDALMAMELALKTGDCSAVLGWLPEAHLGFSELRRLLIAARQGGTWGSLFRPANALRNASAAELRLRLRPGAAHSLRVDIVKRRGGWPVADMELALRAAAPATSRESP